MFISHISHTFYQKQQSSLFPRLHLHAVRSCIEGKWQAVVISIVRAHGFLGKLVFLKRQFD